MNRQRLDYYDATTPEESKGVWTINLLYNGKIYGSIEAETEVLVKKLARRWVCNKIKA